MSKFKPGQKVVCIRDTNPISKFWKSKVITEGEIVTVKDIVIGIGGDLIIDFIEYPAQESGFLGKCYYHPSSFAPLIEPTTGFVEVTYSHIKEANPKICAS